MANIQVRLPDDDADDLDALATDLHASRSETARNALSEGMRVLRTRRALERYVEGDYSLERAAEYAGIGLAALAAEAARRGLPYMRYPPDEVAGDARKVREAADRERGA
jgi:predicted HTH domain antitoxin